MPKIPFKQLVETDLFNLTSGGFIPPKGDTAPASGVLGQLFYDTDDNQLLAWTGAAFEPVAEAGIAGVSSFNTRTGAVSAASNDYTWAQINKTTSDIADITTKSHTSLSDIGTNTHAQLDTALAKAYLNDASLIPAANHTYDLGSTTYKFKDLWLNGVATIVGRIDMLTGATDSAKFHLGETANEGLYMASVSDNHFNIGAGVERVGGSYYARSTAAGLLATSAGNYGLYTDASLTDGYTYTPSLRYYATNTGKHFFGGETASDVIGTGGVCIKQTGGGCGLELKLDGFTNTWDWDNIIEPDTYLSIYPAGGTTNGGAVIIGAALNTSALTMLGALETETTTTSTSAAAATRLIGWKQTNATAVGALGATANILAIKNYSTNLYLVKGNGDILPCTNGTQDLGDSTHEFDSTYTEKLFVSETVGSHLIPATNETYDLGSAVNQWDNIYATGGFFSQGIMTAGCVPLVDDTYNIGAGVLRWDNIYATNSVIQTSDRRDKKEIEPTTLGLNFIEKLNPVSFKWNGKTRKHQGLIAQEVEEVVVDLLGDTTNFAGIIKTEEGRYGLRYDEFIPSLIKSIQELSAEVKRLKEK